MDFLPFSHCTLPAVAVAVHGVTSRICKVLADPLPIRLSVVKSNFLFFIAAALAGVAFVLRFLLYQRRVIDTY